MRGEFPAMRFSPALLPFSRHVADNFLSKNDRGLRIQIHLARLSAGFG
jgi:hypothetical protein